MCYSPGSIFLLFCLNRISFTFFLYILLCFNFPMFNNPSILILILFFIQHFIFSHLTYFNFFTDNSIIIIYSFNNKNPMKKKFPPDYYYLYTPPNITISNFYLWRHFSSSTNFHINTYHIVSFYKVLKNLISDFNSI